MCDWPHIRHSHRGFQKNAGPHFQIQSPQAPERLSPGNSINLMARLSLVPSHVHNTLYLEELKVQPTKGDAIEYENVTTSPGCKESHQLDPWF